MLDQRHRTDHGERRGGEPLHSPGRPSDPFFLAVRAICRALAIDIVTDSDGGRRILDIEVAGAAGVPFVPGEVSLRVGEVPVVRGGRGTGRNGAALRRLFNGPRVNVRLDVGGGPGRATLWTCDLTREYVEFSSRYTS